MNTLNEKVKRVQALVKNLTQCQDDIDALLMAYYDESWQREYLLNLSNTIGDEIPTLAKVIGYEILDNED